MLIAVPAIVMMIILRRLKIKDQRDLRQEEVGQATKTDEFSGKFQTAFDLPPPTHIPDNCHFFYTDTIFGAEILHPKNA